MAPPVKIKLYVDTVSPFAYEAYYIFRNDPVFSKCEITYVPMFLGGLMKTCGNTAPIQIKNKDKWIHVERNRWATAFHIPMKEEAPVGFPNPSLATMRALCALTLLHPGATGQQKLTQCLDALWDAYWVHHRKTYEKDDLADILREVLGADATAVLEMAGKEGKELLLKNTDMAFEEGAFGLPWMVATDREGRTEGFWGVDHLAQIAEYLGLDRPRTGGWKALL